MDLVFVPVIDPSIDGGDPEKKAKLAEVHDGKKPVLTKEDVKKLTDEAQQVKKIHADAGSYRCLIRC